MTLKGAILWTLVFITIIWFLLPAADNRYFGQSSLVRFDPQISTDYNCIYLEGYSARRFTVPWLTRSTPVSYLRFRYTPNDDDTPYGILFVDPRTFAYEAHAGWAAAPTRLTGRLDSPQPILDWIRSQPHSALAPSHTNDAREIYAALRQLAPRDLEHFSLATNAPLHNFTIGFQKLGKRDRPDFLQSMWIFWLWIPVLFPKTNKPKLVTARERMWISSVMVAALVATGLIFVIPGPKVLIFLGVFTVTFAIRFGAQSWDLKRRRIYR